jgi:hypothetical protein
MANSLNEERSEPVLRVGFQMKLTTGLKNLRKTRSEGFSQTMERGYMNERWKLGAVVKGCSYRIANG